LVTGERSRRHTSSSTAKAVKDGETPLYTDRIGMRNMREELYIFVSKTKGGDNSSPRRRGET
jgi:hypothetical protein